MEYSNHSIKGPFNSNCSSNSYSGRSTMNNKVSVNFNISRKIKETLYLPVARPCTLLINAGLCSNLISNYGFMRLSLVQCLILQLKQ